MIHRGEGKIEYAIVNNVEINRLRLNNVEKLHVTRKQVLKVNNYRAKLDRKRARTLTNKFFVNETRENRE